MNKIFKRGVLTVVVVVMGVLIFALVSMAAERKWTCSRYYNGNYEGYTTFWANSYEEAMEKAREFWKNKTVHSIKCE